MIGTTPWMICLLGPPGAGKGTQGALLASAFGGTHLSVGELVRARLAAGARIPRDRKSRLVDTAYTVDMILAGGCQRPTPIVLDGFPRDASQVEALLELPWRCAAVLWLNVDLDTAIKRMMRRGRTGEDVAQIGMRHLNHDASAGDLRARLNAAGLSVHDIEGRGDVAGVQDRCREITHSTCG